MSDRVHVCAACDDPSPGPIKRLYYQPRKHGPFFPVLAEQKTGDKVGMFSAGRVSVCTGCASHLQRQWAAYEKNWTPLEKRTYTLLAVERQHKVDGHQEPGATSYDHATKQLWWKATKSLAVQQGIVDRLQVSRDNENTAENPGSRLRLAAQQVNTRNPSTVDRFSLAAQQVNTGNTGAVDRFRMAAQQVQRNTDTNADSSSFQDVVQMVHDMNTSRSVPETTNERDELVPYTPPGDHSSWDAKDMQDQLPHKLRESTDILIQKMAEIQYEENLRQSQETIRDALDRVKHAQNRPRFVKTLGRDLKERLYRELEFRSANASLVERPSRRALKKENEAEDLKHKQILQELEREKEWQRRTETMIAKQERMVEELREEVKKEIQGVLEEQNKHYEEMKRLLQHSRAAVPHNGSDHAYVSLEGSSHSGSNMERKASSRKRRRRRDLNATEQHNSASSTPEFYIQ